MINQKTLWASLFIIFSFLLTGYGQQDKKPVYYFDEAGEIISPETYRNTLDIRYNLPTYFENDTAFFAKLLARNRTGYLNKTVQESIYKELSQLSRREFDPSSTLIINYFPTGVKYADYYFKQKAYQKAIKKNRNLDQLFLLQHDFPVPRTKTPLVWDKNRKFERLFFSEYKQGVSYLILKPDGSYYKYFGEYQLMSVLEEAENNFNSKKIVENPQSPGLIEPKNLVPFNKGNPVHKDYKVISYYFNNKDKNFIDVKGDFHNIRTNAFDSLSMGAAFYAEKRRYKNTIEVMLRSTTKNHKDLFSKKINVYSTNLGSLRKVKNPYNYKQYSTLTFIAELDIDKRAETESILLNDVISIQIEDEIFQYVSPFLSYDSE